MVVQTKLKKRNKLKTNKGVSTKSEKLSKKPLVKHEEGEKWYEHTDSEVASVPSDGERVRAVEARADELLRRDVDLFSQSERKIAGSEASWLRTVVSKGTAVDRWSAMQLLVRSSPVHSLSHLGALVAVVEKKNSRDALSVIDVLKDLFITELLPPSRKLIFFFKRPLEKLKEQSLSGEKQLILWKFESDLKVLYERFVDAIEGLAGGNVENVCARACRVALNLLIERPELESKLLSLLVNKLGHPNHKLASRVCAYLTELTQRHAAMRPVIVADVERLIYRRNVSCKAQLYAVSFLSQIRLQAGEADLATALLNIYFGLFRLLIARDKMDDKVLSILLSATNRAFPYAKEQSEKLSKEIDTLYKLLHQSNFATALQTLKLLQQLLATGDGGVSDRFYAALYRRLLDTGYSSSLEAQLLTLVFRTLRTDSVERRAVAFVKRLLQLSLNRSAAFAAACLVHLSRLLQERPALLVIEKPASKLLGVDSLKVEETVTSNTEDEEERYFDVPDEAGEGAEKPKGIEEVVSAMKEEIEETDDKGLVVNNRFNARPSGWLHRENIVVRSEGVVYDPSARNPLFARTDLSISSELLLLRQHFHPSVAVFATNILEGIPIRYESDPLTDLTTMRFLDRFVYRNPKTKHSTEAGDEPRRPLRRKAYNPVGVKKLPINSKEYIKKKENEIPVDERFLHRFAVSKLKVKVEGDEGAQQGDEEAHDFDDIESVNSEEFDRLLEHFEPGEKNDVFDIDFAKEFGAEKSRSEKAAKKRGAKDGGDGDEEDEDEVEEDGSDVDDFDDGDDVEGEEEDFDEEDGSEDDDDDEEEEEYDGILEGEESDEDRGGRRHGRHDDDDSDDEHSDEDYTSQMGFAEDAAVSADKMVELMENESEMMKRKKKQQKRTKKPRGFKKRRLH